MTGRIALVELLIARNPDPDSTPRYLLRQPVGDGGLVFRTKGPPGLALRASGVIHPFVVVEVYLRRHDALF